MCLCGENGNTKTRLLKGPCGGRREEQDGGGFACGTHHFYRVTTGTRYLRSTDTRGGVHCHFKMITFTVLIKYSSEETSTQTCT